MKYPTLDKVKLKEVEDIIEEINHLVIDENCDEESLELQAMTIKLREVTGKDDLSILPFMYYSSYTTLEDAAITALMPTPQKMGLSKEEIKELIGKIINAEILELYGEAMNDYFVEVLELETGLDNILDYLYNPTEIGLDRDASVEDIIEKIMNNL